MKLLLPVIFLACANGFSETIHLDSLDLSKVRQGYGVAQTNFSITGKPLTIAGSVMARGVGSHANSVAWVRTAGKAARFTARVGVDEGAKTKGSIVFRVIADGKTVFDSGVLRGGEQSKPVDVQLAGAQLVLLQVKDAGDGIAFDHANWGDARFEVEPGANLELVEAPREVAEVLTPPPATVPRINGPTVYGCRPGNPFIYRIPIQGEKPFKITARGLPRTLRLDPATGIISGTAPERGEYRVKLGARNGKGSAAKEFRIASGDKLALTPPMGWNHWYAHYNRVTDKTIREAADLMISSGMADVGYEYVNIDDCWMNAPKHEDPIRVGPLRDSQGRMLSNKYFPDMKVLADYIHERGLKAGLYTSPGPLTCAGFAGSWEHEAVDAKTYAEWGYDFLKYDWCSYGRLANGKHEHSSKVPNLGKGSDLEAYKYPYSKMGTLLRQQRRDIVYNLCQYGMGNVWEWGEEVDGHCWRTAGDLGFELDRVFEVALMNAEHRKWSRPGAWNDPDYIQIGWIGNARGGGVPTPTTMSPNEQYAYMSLWCLMAAPLFYSGDMARLDPFTLNILSNPEVIEVDQDSLGESAAVTRLSPETFVMVKTMADGSRAVGMFNQSEFSLPVKLSWDTAGLIGPAKVRDLWRQVDLGTFSDEFSTTVPRRGGVLVRATPAPSKRR